VDGTLVEKMALSECQHDRPFGGPLTFVEQGAPTGKPPIEYDAPGAVPRTASDHLLGNPAPDGIGFERFPGKRHVPP
jgi:hypothetical protein